MKEYIKVYESALNNKWLNVQDNEGIGIITQDGDIVLPPIFDYIKDSYDGYIEVEYEGILYRGRLTHKDVISEDRLKEIENDKFRILIRFDCYAIILDPSKREENLRTQYEKMQTLRSCIENYKKHELKEFSALNHIQQLFNNMLHRIHFKPNSKYDSTFATYYIGFTDMSTLSYSIRKKTGDSYQDDEDPIIAKYYSLEELLADGWILD